MWYVKQQSNIAHSVAEAEYCCLTPGVHQIRWVRSLMFELRLGYNRATACYTDNTTAQKFAENPVHHTRMKQLHLKFLDLRDLCEWNVIALGRVRTEVNPADIGTNALGAADLEPKANIFFDGLSNLEYEPITRDLTVENDASV